MKRRLLPLVVLTVTLSLAACTDTEPAPEVEEPVEVESVEAPWTYEGETGPERWGTLSEAYAGCEVGREQSPIALDRTTAEVAELPALQFGYGQAALQVENTGHGYKATPAGEHTLQIGDDTYRLLQFHPHTPSEHTIGGQKYPMVLHFVHQNDAGELAVVGVMVEESTESGAYGPFVEAVSGGQETATVASLEALLPSDRTYFTYPGSLTTPPCTEGVRWIVLQEPVTLSPQQIDVFEAHGETDRPLMPIGDRTVRVSG